MKTNKCIVTELSSSQSNAIQGGFFIELLAGAVIAYAVTQYSVGFWNPGDVTY